MEIQVLTDSRVSFFNFQKNLRNPKTVQDFQHLNVEALLDLLAGLTKDYTRAIINGANKEDLSDLRKTVTSIQSELMFRKETYDRFGNNSTTSTDINSFR
jgi:hypothetical protein